MAFYKDSDQFYTCARALFDRLQSENPEAAEEIVRARILVRLNCTHPSSVILVNGRRRPAEITYGTNRIRPEVDIELQTDTLHAILMGKLSVSTALAKKQIRVRGPVWKAAALSGFFQEGQKLYAEILEEQGLLSANKI